MTKDNKQYRILMIEDNPGDFFIVEELLRDMMSRPAISHAVNYQQACAHLTESGLFDIVLLDLSLPDKDGRELVTDILHLTQSCCPVIILTGYSDIDFSIRSVSEGVSDYLLKDDLNAGMLYKSIIYAIERNKIVADLTSSEKQYSDLFNLSPQPMCVFEIDSLKFVQVNKAMIQLYEYSEDELFSMTLLDIKMEEDVLEATKLIKSRKTESHLCIDQVRHRTKSGIIRNMEIYGRTIMLNNKYCRSVVAIDVTEKNQQDRRILKAIIKTQEDERYEIGGELHDNVCQLLAVSQLSLGMLKSSLPVSGIYLYDQCKENISMALTEIRNLSHRLAPVFFDDISLDLAFRKLIDSFNIDNNFDVTVYVEPLFKKYIISAEIQLNLYRIMQEQLRNIIKYSKGTKIDVDVVIYNKKIRMMIADNGVGFNPIAVKHGIGLANMKRRTELFSGKFELVSSPGNGCIVIVEIPLQTSPEILVNNKLQIA